MTAARTLDQGAAVGARANAWRHSPVAAGWWHTRGVGLADTAGSHRVVARSTRAARRAARPFHPRPAEHALRAQPAIHDACAIGLPRGVPGKQVCARVVPVRGAAITAGEPSGAAREMAHDSVPAPAGGSEAFPSASRGETRRRELERAIALDHTATATST